MLHIQQVIENQLKFLLHWLCKFVTFHSHL